MKHCPKTRPYKDVAEMNAALEQRWNETVGPTDTIWLLGDFGFSHSKLEGLADIFARLSGHKHLVAGNHDEKNRAVLKLPWERIEKLYTLRDHERRAELCHYPLETWKHAHRGALMLHGHSHGTLKRRLPHRYDVGVEVEPVPVSLEALFERAAAETFQPGDHHGEDL